MKPCEHPRRAQRAEHARREGVPAASGHLLCFVLAVAGMASLASCQSLLGIHGSKPAPNDASSNATGGGKETGGATGDAAAAGGQGGSAAGGTGGILRDAGSTGGMVGTAGSIADAGAKGGGGGGGSGSDGGTNDGSTVEVSYPDAGSCQSPWHAENVEAHILAVNTTGATACSIAWSDVSTLAAGVDATSFRAAAACGACIRVQATTGGASVIVTIVEKSGAAGILLSRAAMDRIATPGADLANVNWTLVPCDVGSQPVRYYVKEGSNAGYVGIQVRNARYPLASVSVIKQTVVPLALQTYNYWESTAAGAGPLTLRLTDLNGQAFDEVGIKVDPGSVQTGKGQFPLCH